MQTRTQYTAATIADATANPLAEIKAAIQDIQKAVHVIRRESLAIGEAMPQTEEDATLSNVMDIATAGDYIDPDLLDHSLNTLRLHVSSFQRILNRKC